jgi:hypothetical protein
MMSIQLLQQTAAASLVLESFLSDSAVVATLQVLQQAAGHS